MKTIVIRPDKIKEDWAKVKSASEVRAVFMDTTYKLPHTLDILGKNVEVVANSGRPKLLANGSISAHFSLGKSSVNAHIDGLELSSGDPYKSRPHGFMVHGVGVHLSNIIGSNLYYFANFTGTARNAVIEDCRNPESIDGYFAYLKGRGHTVRRIVTNRPLAGFVRTNESSDLTIEDIESFGVGAGNAMYFVGRLQLQYTSDVTVRNFTVHGGLVTIGPLWNIDGWKQRKSDAEFFARRTKNITIHNLRIDNNGWIEFRPGSENVRVWTADGKTPRIEWGKPDPKLPAWVQKMLSPAKDIWVNDKKLR